VQAEILTRRVLLSDPGNVSAILILARIHIDLGAPASAAQSLLGIIDRVPDSAQTHLALADAFFLSNFTRESIPHYIRARDLGFHGVELCNNLAAAFARENDMVRAVAEWKAALALEPENANALSCLRKHGALEERLR
jgi:cytochrome c-type biogenesis protein CcmH/NrfG